jgi:glycosyltransferase involved in cell wall biosynthesis
MKVPMVTVIIPTYNSCELLAAAVESVLAQSWKNIELIIVNDGSTDMTEITAKKYLEQGESHDPRVRYFQTEQNFGKNHALNIGIAHSKGDFLAFLDHDDTYPPDTLRTGVEFLDSHPEIAAVYGDACKIDFNGKSYEIRKSRQVHCIADIAGFFRNPIASSSMIMRKRIIDEIGKLDEFFFRIDDVCRNLLVFQLGKMAYIPSVLMNYRIYKRDHILKFRMRTLLEFYQLINRYIKGPQKMILYCKQTIFQIVKLIWEFFTFKK